MIRESLSDKVSFEQRHEGNERETHEGVKGFASERGKSNYKA